MFSVGECMGEKKKKNYGESLFQLLPQFQELQLRNLLWVFRRSRSLSRNMRSDCIPAILDSVEMCHFSWHRAFQQLHWCEGLDVLKVHNRTECPSVSCTSSQILRSWITSLGSSLSWCLNSSRVVHLLQDSWLTDQAAQRSLKHSLQPETCAAMSAVRGWVQASGIADTATPVATRKKSFMACHYHF